jgi:hypothetical protein
MRFCGRHVVDLIISIAALPKFSFLMVRDQKRHAGLFSSDQVMG